MRLLLLALIVVVSSAQTITFSQQPFSRIPGTTEYRVYVAAPQPMQVQAMQVIVEAMHQNIRLYSYVTLRAYVDDYNKRSIWRWVGIGAEVTGWVFTSAEAVKAAKIKEKWITSAIAGSAGLLTIGRTVYDREYKPVTMPADLMPPLIAVPPGGAVDFAVWAAP